LKRFVFTLLVVILVSGSLLAACAAPAPSTTPSPTPTPTPTPVPGILKPWTAEIEKACNGRIKITHYPGETLVKSADEYNAVVSGICDMTTVDPEESPGLFPIAEIQTLPFLFPGSELCGRVYHEILNKYAANTELKNVKILIATPLHPAQIFSKKKIEVLNDFKRLKWRAAGKVESWSVDALGAVPVEVATGDVSGALDRGMIEGVFFTWSAGLAFGAKDVTKYRTECDFQTRAFILAINKQLWDKLPDDLQKAIGALATPEVSGRYGAAHGQMAAGARGAIAGSDKAAGNPGIYVLPKEEKDLWIKTTSSVYNNWIEDLASKNIQGKPILDEARSLVNKYSPAK
jgi:TRAP-type C4-dicarboxylate transport system substrate-binding protein